MNREDRKVRARAIELYEDGTGRDWHDCLEQARDEYLEYLNI